MSGMDRWWDRNFGRHNRNARQFDGIQTVKGKHGSTVLRLGPAFDRLTPAPPVDPRPELTAELAAQRKARKP